jgi:hypothetical protein
MKITLTILIALATLNCSRAEPRSECATIHKPASGCPAGYTKVAGYFQRDGKLSDACISRAKDRSPCIDVLYPGESIKLTFDLGGDEAPAEIKRSVVQPQRAKTPPQTTQPNQGDRR